MRRRKLAILEAVYATAKGLHKAGVMDQITLREFDCLCNPPVARLLDPRNDITLSSLQRAAAMVGRRVMIELV